MQKCWLLGYNIHGVGELIGFIGLLTLPVTIAYMLYIAIFGDFAASTWLLLLIPFGMGVVSEVMVQVSWAMVSKRGFNYDHEKREASWIENGRRVTYQYAQHNADEKRPGGSPLA